VSDDTAENGVDADSAAVEPESTAEDLGPAADDGTDTGTAEVAEAPPTAATREPGGARRILAFVALPALALALALGAGYLKWRADTVRDDQLAATSSVQAARDITVTLLSYRPETVEAQLGAARDLLTGGFRESYTRLTDDVVIPGAKQKRITAVASVPAAASVSATPSEAVVLVFVNQTVSVAGDPPTDTASSVRVTLDKVGDRWLISQFDPV
jgi:Mce-associated membrane protein